MNAPCANGAIANETSASDLRASQPRVLLHGRNFDGRKGETFGKGGLGCLVAFVVVAILAVLLGGSAHIDLGGAVLLFVIGGVVGLVVLWIYNRGKRGK